MNTFKCVNCGKQRVEGKNCNVCGYRPNSGLSGCAVAGIVLAGIVVFFSFASLFFSDDETDSKDIEHNSLYAYSFAEKNVKDMLKSPATAEFPSSSEQDQHTKYIGDNTYEINSYVDSQNGFGAMMRTRFSCKIVFNDDNTVSTKELVFD